MKLADILSHYAADFKAQYVDRLLPSHLKALDALLRCRTPQAGQLKLNCTDCDQTTWQPGSCGHRNCTQCQNHETSQWLDRQFAKLLPITYFMVTFTLPYELRSLAWHNQSAVYKILFDCAASTLKDFGLNPNNPGADLGMTGVLHTHSRRLEYHPHCHFVVPGGGINVLRKQWKKVKAKYLFNEFALANVFRARCLDAFNKEGLSIPIAVPTKWVVDSNHVGHGKPALKYLARYLYRGVISKNSIVANHDGEVTFKYTESNTGKTRYRTLKGEYGEFVLPANPVTPGKYSESFSGNRRPTAYSG